jgi:hypothetical protein
MFWHLPISPRFLSLQLLRILPENRFVNRSQHPNVALDLNSRRRS